MQQSKRRATTVQLKPGIAKAMRKRAALRDQTLNDVVNEVLAADVKRLEEHVRVARQRLAEGGRLIPLAEVLEKAGLSDLL